MNLFRVPIVLVLSFFIVSCVAGRLPGHRSLSTTTYGYAVTSELARAGEKSQRFEVRPGDCGADSGWSDCKNDRERSEFRLERGFSPGGSQWIGFSIYLPEDFQSSNFVNTTLGQIHQRGGPRGTIRGLPSNPPLLQLELKGDVYRACVHVLSGPSDDVRDDCHYFDLADLHQMRGRWTDVAIHLDTKARSSSLEIFVNELPKAELRDFISFWPKTYYLKYGLYRSFVSKHQGAMPPQIAYYDEVRMGATRDAIAINPENPVD